MQKWSIGGSKTSRTLWNWRGDEPLDLLVCGGAALAVMGLVTRATGDMSGGKHLSDLKQLGPTAEELVDAARWCVQQDPSEGFRGVLEWFLKQEGYDDVVERISE